MGEPMSDLGFKGMSFFFKLRDLVVPRRKVLEEAGIKPGDRVLDYGCGPGAYVPDTAQMVGQSGRVYALDVHPLAIDRVSKMADKRGLTNVRTIQSDCQTGLPGGSVDVVLLYDIFHMLSEPDAILAEMHRVLKPDGVLSFNDHHLRETDLVGGMTRSGLFELARRGERTYSFARVT